MSDFKTFGFEYPYNGKQCVIQIEAESPDDAIARLNALPNAEYIGELVDIIDSGAEIAMSPSLLRH